MKRPSFQEVLISPEPGAFWRGRKVLVSHKFRKPPDRLAGVRLAISIHEQDVVYLLLGHHSK
jgi:hypothetical protein